MYRVVKYLTACGVVSLSLMSHGKCLNSPSEYVYTGMDVDHLLICEGEVSKSMEVDPLFCDEEPEGVPCEDFEGGEINSKISKWVFKKGSQARLNHRMFTKIGPAFEILEKAKSGKNFLIRTGDFKLVSLSKTAFQSKCFKEMIYSAVRLQSHFPKFNFVIDPSIKNCRHLREGVHLMINERGKVKSNLSKIHTPLHSIYLTDQTKFNHYVMGEMGLYVNVNKRGEIKRRIVDFKISRFHITHETLTSRVGGHSRSNNE